MVQDCLVELGVVYGDYVVYNGLWDVVVLILYDFVVCFVVVFLVFEVWGLDVIFGMIDWFIFVGDQVSVNVFKVIYEEEIVYVVVGVCWFYMFCCIDD